MRTDPEWPAPDQEPEYDDSFDETRVHVYGGAENLTDSQRAFVKKLALQSRREEITFGRKALTEDEETDLAIGGPPMLTSEQLAERDDWN